MKSKEICSIPVEATYDISGDHPVLKDAVYEDIPADAIARFILQRMGITPVPKDGKEEDV